MVLSDPENRKFRFRVMGIGSMLTLALAAAILYLTPPHPREKSSFPGHKDHTLSNQLTLNESEHQSLEKRSPQVTFAMYCAQCHVQSGRGDTAMGRMMARKPTNLVYGPFRFQRTSAALTSIIQRGIGVMPGFGEEMTQEEAEELAQFVASLAITTREASK